MIDQGNTMAFIHDKIEEKLSHTSLNDDGNTKAYIHDKIEEALRNASIINKGNTMSYIHDWSRKHGVQKKNECVPGCNDALWIHLWINDRS